MSYTTGMRRNRRIRLAVMPTVSGGQAHTGIPECHHACPQCDTPSRRSTFKSWIGCDINKGAIQTTAKRLQGVMREQAAARANTRHRELLADVPARKQDLVAGRYEPQSMVAVARRS